MIFTFSILHYKTINDTIECIESIENLNQPCEIVIINNDENVDDFNMLKHKYKYAKDVLKSDFIAVINNDAVVELKVNF